MKIAEELEESQNNENEEQEQPETEQEQSQHQPPPPEIKEEAPPAPEGFEETDGAKDIFNMMNSEPEFLGHDYQQAEELEEEDHGEEEPDDGSHVDSESLKKIALLIAFVANKVNAMGCGFVSDEDPEKFEISKKGEKELGEALGIYFESTNYTPSPAAVLVAVLLALFGEQWLKAFKIRMKKQKKKTEQRGSKGAGAGKSQNRYKPQEQAQKQAERAASPTATTRTKFNVDKRGFYEFEDRKGQPGKARRLRVAERSEKPTQSVIQLLSEGKSNGEIFDILNAGA